jgi:chromosomal replication initiator protein
MVGRANELAHKAALQLATAAEPVAYNPLYLHGSVGLGKSHLLHAIAHAGRAAGRRVVYLTAERFMYGFVQALKSQSAIAFKDKLRGIDILLIDDLQFLQGKHMQAEFGHTLNALLDGSRQVVVAADRPPCDLETADERM